MRKLTHSGLGIVLLTSCFVLAAGCAKKDPMQPTSGPSGPTTASDAPAKDPEIKTTAEAMAKEVIADEKAAAAKYKDKVVEVEGKVFAANRIIGNNRQITLVGAKKKPTDVLGVDVACIPAAANLDQAWSLGRGQKVKVVGQVVAVSAGFGGITLDRCSVTEVDKSPTPTVTADALVGEFAKDPEAAKKKYTESDFVMKEVIVEGTVADSTSSPDGTFHFVDLEGKNGQTVRFTVNKETKDSLKKGDKVTMKGDVSLYDKDKKQLTVNTAFVLKKG
jgi:hypothetical protein